MARPARRAGWPRRSLSPPGCGRAGPRYALWAALCPGRIGPRRPARRPGPPPSFYYRPGRLLPGADLLLVALGGLAGGDLHTPPDPVQQQIQPRPGVLHSEPSPGGLGDARQRPALVLIPPPSAGPVSSAASSSPTCAPVSLHGPPPGPFDISAARPPADSARRQRFADIRVTRKRFATSRSLAPASIRSAAANRTCSRRARSIAVSPPPSGYLMPPA